MSYMNVQVKHNGEDITGYLDNYTRQQKICTGIGTLEISFVNTINNTFEPWDIIELYEEGHKKGTYYVDIASNSIPDSLIMLSCRDGCKKLMDYFISDSYYINYPSYNKMWIEQFLEEAQVNYEFNVADNGSLLSNNTTLGNSSAYDQIIPLLQMSGWYIYFDADGKAVVGKLQTDLSSPSLSINKTDILNIKQSKNDKMLRNRVVVWGGIEEATSTLVAAEAVVSTPWNYDEYDLRTSVISSSSIRSNADAYNIANMALSEFAQITVEKTIECYGGRHVSIGHFVSVSSDVFSGVGLVTTVGSTLSKDGFKTTLILDERCPRLFAFFDFGDFVYVSTVGEGVWRKPLDSADWQDFSVGLGDLRVTDLYKNSGILSAVTMSGTAYYNIEETGVWYPINLQGLSTVTTISGVVASGTLFSGTITARAVIQDRITNNLRIAAGSNNNDNYVDYSTGVTILSSGISPRSWVVDFNANTATIEGSYPIHVGDYYGYDVLDIENDGVFDYVTVGASGMLQIKIDEAFFGNTEGVQWHPEEDSQTTYTTMIEPIIDYDVVVGQPSYGAFFADKAICTYDSPLLRAVVGVGQTLDLQQQFIYGRYMAEGQPRVFTEEYEVEIPKNLRVLGIHQDSSHQYNIFSSVIGTTNTYTFGTIRFNNHTYTPGDTFIISGNPSQTYINLGNALLTPYYIPNLKTGHIIWGVKIETDGPTSKVYGLSVDMRSSTFTERLILDCGGDGKYPNRVSNSAVITPLTSGGVLIKVNRCEMEVNDFGLVSSAKYKIVCFSGPDFTMFEHESVTSNSVELNRWPQGHIAISISSVGVVSSAANIAFAYISSPFINIVDFVRSSYPINEGYDGSGTERNSRIVRNNYATLPNSIVDTGSFWTAGENYKTKILGIGKDSLYGIYDFLTGNLIKNFNIPNGYSASMLPHTDSINGHVYFLAKNTGTGLYYLLDYTPEADLERYILLSVNEDVPGELGAPVQNAESWLILNTGAGLYGLQVLYIHLYNLAFAPLVIYSVLKREKEDFTVLRSDFKNMRLDDSLGMPLISVSDKLKTTSLMRNYASGYSFTNILTEGPREETIVHDFKYTSTGITPISSGVIASGVTTSGIIGRNFVYTSDTGINTIPMDNSLHLDQNSLVFGADAGIPYRLETTNYKFPNQRIFTVTSGEAGNRFFQSDPVVSGFMEYTSGFPQTVITRIRVDDRL